MFRPSSYDALEAPGFADEVLRALVSMVQRVERVKCSLPVDQMVRSDFAVLSQGFLSVRFGRRRDVVRDVVICGLLCRRA